MQNRVIKLIDLVSLGNRYLFSKRISGVKPSSLPSVFTETQNQQQKEDLVFGAESVAFIDNTKMTTVNNTVAWFDQLHNNNVSRLSLSYNASAELSNDATSGLLLTSSERSSEDRGFLWRNSEEMDPKNPKLMRHRYVNDGQLVQVENNSPDTLRDRLETSRIRIDQALTLIIKFCESETHAEAWRDIFSGARFVLHESDSSESVVLNVAEQIVPNDQWIQHIHKHNHDLANCIMNSIHYGWVFGGVGSWSDFVPSTPDNALQFERVTNELYASFIEGIALSTNAL